MHFILLVIAIVVGVALMLLGPIFAIIGAAFLGLLLLAVVAGIVAAVRHHPAPGTDARPGRGNPDFDPAANFRKLRS
jgi:hypothetical protein